MTRTAFEVAAHDAPAQGLHPLFIADGTLEACKWLGMVLMALDHVNKYLLGGANPVLFDLGRMVMPVFGFVLMHHLARFGALAAGVHARVMQRLLVVGALSSPAFVALGGWWPLNILFTLLLSTCIVWLLEKGGRQRILVAVMAFGIGGALVEFGWFGVLACLGAWAYCRQPTKVRLVWWAVTLACLWCVNQNFAAVAAVPLVWGAAQVDITLVRYRWLFYAFYPSHLALIWLATRFS